MEEFEIKFLEVNVSELEQKLIAIGARKIGTLEYKRVLFDDPKFTLNENNEWIRVRTDGKEATLSYKKQIGVKANDGSIPDEGMKEIEVVVDNYQKTCEILKSIGFIVRQEAENTRLRYQKEDITYDIDFWVNIPPYVEIESSISLENAKAAARELGFDLGQGLICSVKQVYKKYGYDIDDYYFIGPKGMVKKEVAK